MPDSRDQTLEKPVDPRWHALDAYDFHLPGSLIAQSAVEPRDASRLMVLDRAKGEIEHARFRDLPRFLKPGDALVANNTRVMRARLLGRRLLPDGTLGGKTEFLMLKRVGEREWEGLFHASAKADPGLRFSVPTPSGGVLTGEITQGFDAAVGGTLRAKFDRDPIASEAGEIPLPPYIERDRPSREDEARYQTVYSDRERLGSAAAPTAGLHFTPELLEQVRAMGASWDEVTLHVGAGTFRPVKSEDIRNHVMHSEFAELSERTAERLNGARSQGRRVIAVGTTTVRTLESSVEASGQLAACAAETSIFIRPGYRFKAVDAVITNFHLPKSSLLMMITAFAHERAKDPDLLKRAYEIAVQEKYRFFSFGDAMLIL